MPRIDDPSSKLKTDKVKPFKKESLRPWDTIESITNRYQIDNIIDNKPVTNRIQTDNEPITKTTVIDIKPVTNKEQSGNVIGNDSITNFHFNKLSRLQQNILFFIANECKKTGTFETKVVYRSSIAAAVSAGENTVKTITRRLEKKGAVATIESKAGKEGWSRYKIPEPIFKEILRNESNAVIDNKPVTLSITQNTYSSSNIKTTTTDLNEDWKNIDCEPLAEIGFCAEHLKQLGGRNTPEIVQQSIYHFAFYLETHQPENPLKLFMGVLRKSHAWIEAKYRSPQERALEAVLEAKRIEQERVKRMEAELIEAEFSIWSRELTSEQKRAIWTESTAKYGPGPAKQAELKQHFIENVYKK